MQLCGVRGGGNAASKSLFWQARKGLSYVLTFESERDRNAAIMIARKYALDCNVSVSPLPLTSTLPASVFHFIFDARLAFYLCR